MTEIIELFGHLREAGYDPSDDDWADLTASGVGSIRVQWGGFGDPGTVSIYRFDRYMATEWKIDFGNTPAPVIVAALEAAEAELAQQAGRPVTTVTTE